MVGGHSVEGIRTQFCLSAITLEGGKTQMQPRACGPFLESFPDPVCNGFVGRIYWY